MTGNVPCRHSCFDSVVAAPLINHGHSCNVSVHTLISCLSIVQPVIDTLCAHGLQRSCASQCWVVPHCHSSLAGVATVVTDTPRFKHYRKETVALVTSILGFICSIAFITDIGFYLLDAVRSDVVSADCSAYGGCSADAVVKLTVATATGTQHKSSRCMQL